MFADYKDGEWSTKQFPEEIVCAEGGYVYFWWISLYHDLQVMQSEESYDSCDFTNATDLSPSTNSDMSSHFVPCPPKGETTYVACSIGAHCSLGQRVAIRSHPTASVFSPTGETQIHFDNFADLMNIMGVEEDDRVQILHRGYDNPDSASVLMELLWCIEDHCDTPSCKANVYNIAGFISRKRPDANMSLAEAYYSNSTAIFPGLCPAYIYLMELYDTTMQMIKLQQTAINYCSECESNTALTTYAKENVFDSMNVEWSCQEPHVIFSSSGNRSCSELYDIFHAEGCCGNMNVQLCSHVRSIYNEKDCCT